MKPYYQDKWVTIYHADCREILPDLPKVDLVLTDPPYNIGKDTWDTIPDYTNWLVGRFKLCELRLKQNGTFWFFHMEFQALVDLDIAIREQTNLRHRQFIILDKGIQSIAGRTSDKLRTFPRATEYLQFYSFEDPTGAEQLGEQYQAINPMAKYLKSEFQRAGVNNKELAKLFPSKTGGLTGCVSNWLLGFNFPTKEQYETMRHYLNKNQEYEYLRQEYEDLRQEYEDLRQEYEDLRYIFNMPQGVTDVWNMNCYRDNNNKHSTSKPSLPVDRVITAMSKEQGLILDPFLGSGTTAYCAKKLNRRCIGIEIEEKYCSIAANRCRQEVMELKI